MKSLRVVAVPLVLVFALGCSGGSTATPTAPTPTRIDVALKDTLTMEPAEFAVSAGVPVTFVVTNTGSIEHEFYLGDEAAQAAHEQEMQAMGGMTHDEPEGIGVEPGETKELTYTFTQPGMTLAGCHLPGHYAAGMKAAITVRPR